MMKTLILFFLGLFSLTLPAHAESCADLKSCAKLMYDFKGQRYIWDLSMDGVKFLGAPSVEITKDSAELVFTALLDQAGLARLPVGDEKTYRIVKNVMMKEIEAPVIEASADKAPVFPSNTWDWVTMRYKVKSAEAAPVIEGAYRLHVLREGRMQADENSGLLLVTGPIPMVRQMYQTIKAADRPLTPSAREHYKQFQTAFMAPKSPAAPAPAPAAAPAKKP